MRTLKKLFFGLLTILLLFAGGITAFLYFKKDVVIDQLLTEINKQVNTPIEVKQIDLNWWTDFPNIALTFSDVIIQESYPKSQMLLARLGKLSLSFDLLSIIQGNYDFKEISLVDGEVNIRIDKTGVPNYLILKKGSPSQSDAGVKFDFKDIKLKNVKVLYEDKYVEQNHLLYATDVDAGLSVVGDQYGIEIAGALDSEKISIKDFSYFKDKRLKVKASLLYNDLSKNLTIKPSKIFVNGSEFAVNGSYNIQSNEIMMDAKSENASIQTLLSLLPTVYAKPLAEYQSSGSAFFEAQISGLITEKESPLVKIDFSINEGSFFHPEYKTDFTDIQLEGSFNNGRERNLRTSSLSISTFTALLSKNKLDGKFSINNFEDPFLALALTGNASTADLLVFLPNRTDFSDISGSVRFNVQVGGLLTDLKNETSKGTVTNSGELVLENIGGVYKPYPLPVEAVSGRLLFNQNDVAISRLGGFLGNSDIQCTGFFLNIFPYLLSDDESLLIEAETNSQNINLNELLSGLSAEGNTLEEQKESFKFSISSLINIDINSEIANLNFKRFKAKTIRGHIAIKNQRLTADQLSFSSNGGQVLLNGVVNTQKPDFIQVTTEASFAKLNIDSVFYTFEDFDQSFLTHKHLKGKINAEVLAKLSLSPQLDFIPESLLADIDASVKDGALANFEPMQSLSDYVRSEDLRNLTFGELENSIHVEHEKIYLPEMVISSNVTKMLLQGTHTFDQQIDYRILVPLKNYKKRDKDEDFGAIEETSDYTKLHLKLVGTTDDFEVSWDGKRSLKAFGKRILEEGKELKSIFKKEDDKGKVKKIEVDKEDYFDW